MFSLRPLFLCLLIVGFCAPGWAQRLASATDLPDAPSALATGLQQATQQGSGRISGTVLDINGGVVPGATVKLAEIGGPAEHAERVAVSDSAGRFSFDGLGAARFKFTITSQGLETFVSAEIVLKPGESREVPQISLPIASATAEVQVVVTQTELAAEQIHAEEKQRVLGVLPNFYTSYIWNAAPLTKWQKYQLAAKSITDPTDFLGAALIAGVEQQQDTYAGYGQGAKGYAKRFGAAYGDDGIARMLGSAVLPSLLHQDPRYFYKGSGSKKSRALYAIEMAVLTKGDNGKWEPNYSHIGGSFAGGAISNLYHPDGDRGAGLTVGNALIDTAGNAANNLIREFLLRRLTPSVPDYAKGKQ